MKKIGVLINNIGSPENCDPKSVGRYLSEFLNDPYVIQIPNPFRFFLVNGIIVPFRSKASAAKYKKIWGKEKSPLVEITEKLAEKIQKNLGSTAVVRVAMRYSKPSIGQAISDMKKEKIEKIYFLPMYPQYATASTESSVVKFLDELKTQKEKASAFTLKPFFNELGFTDLIARKLKPFIRQESHVIFSYHSLPLAQLQKLDGGCAGVDSCCQRPEALKNCYRAQCLYTSKKIAENLGLNGDRYTNTFQSRLGVNKWIGPNLPIVLEEYAAKYKHIVVTAPSFSTDCLETLEEIDMENRLIGEKLGAKYEYVPCLNCDDEWAKWISDTILEAANENITRCFQSAL